MKITKSDTILQNSSVKDLGLSYWTVTLETHHKKWDDGPIR